MTHEDPIDRQQRTKKRANLRPTLLHNDTALPEMSRYKRTSQKARTYKRLRLDMESGEEIQRTVIKCCEGAPLGNRHGHE